jgi:hypothetical protein
MPSLYQKTATAVATATQSVDHGEYNSNNISQNRICAGEYMHVNGDSYILCIPHVCHETTKMDVARAVEQCILKTGDKIENFEYVKKVIFVRAFDEIVFNNVTVSSEQHTEGSNPWYKIAMVLIDIPHGYDEYGVEIYTDDEEAFYDSVCRGDLVVGTWTDVFFMANPKKYFRPQRHQEQRQQQQQAKKEVCEYQDGAFQKWKYDFKLKQLERKVKEQENTIRQLEFDTCWYQDTINEHSENFRFLTRQTTGVPELVGLNCMSNGLSNYLSVLSNRYSRVCISDTSFLEINKNMKLKKLHGLVINMCDDSDACQELIHSIDFIDALEHPELFLKIQKLICRINHSVQQFEKLHLHAERSLFGLRNRKVFEGFGLFLNTALEIVEEVTSRCSAYTQDLEYATCYGQLHSRLQHYGQQDGQHWQEQQHWQEEQQQYEEGAAFTTSEGTVYGYGYDYDYSECADPLNNEVESTHQMLSYFDQKQQQLYHQQKCQQEQQEQQQQEQQQQEQQQTSLNLDAIDVVYYEEGVIVEGVNGEGVNGEGVNGEGVNGEGVNGEGVSGGDEKQEQSTTTTTTFTTTTTTKTSESEDAENKKKSGGWLSSWF